MFSVRTGRWIARLSSTMRPVSLRTTEIARGRLPKTAPSTRRPWFAKVEKARAISSGLTASAPSPIAKYFFSGLVIPSRFAVRTMAAGPTS